VATKYINGDMSVVLYGCKTWISHTKRRAQTDGVLRKIFGPKSDDVTGEWRKLSKEELHNLYSSPNIIRQIK
jgi:hypothetical protein